MPEIKVRKGYVPVFPPTILIDTREQYPYHFRAIPTDKAEGDASWLITTERVGIPTGDYSLKGYHNKIAVERKSIEDLFQSIGQERERFEAELERLNNLSVGAVVIEAEWSEIAEGVLYSRLAPKTISRSIHAWVQRFKRVHWWTCAGREHAEITVFHILRRFWIDLPDGYDTQGMLNLV